MKLFVFLITCIATSWVLHLITLKEYKKKHNKLEKVKILGRILFHWQWLILIGVFTGMGMVGILDLTGIL